MSCRIVTRQEHFGHHHTHHFALDNIWLQGLTLFDKAFCISQIRNLAVCSAVLPLLKKRLQGKHLDLTANHAWWSLPARALDVNQQLASGNCRAVATIPYLWLKCTAYAAACNNAAYRLTAKHILPAILQNTSGGLVCFGFCSFAKVLNQKHGQSLSVYYCRDRSCSKAATAVTPQYALMGTSGTTSSLSTRNTIHSLPCVNATNASCSTTDSPCFLDEVQQRGAIHANKGDIRFRLFLLG